MSVTHKKSEKQIGAAELEALRASIMAEVEAAHAETEESIISSIRNNLVSIPEQGEEWNEKKSYITGDVVTLDGVSYTATHYSRGKSPASNPDKWTRTPTEEQIGAWADLPDGEVITEGTKVTHNGKKWVCVAQQIFRLFPARQFDEVGRDNITAGRRINDGHFYNGSFRLFYRMRYRVRLYRFCS